jgi:butyryl-CoA dehydrogenase
MLIEGHPVAVSCVHPGGIKTNIARNARIDESAAALAGGDEAARNGFDKIALTTPKKAAQQILAAVEKDRRRALIGPDAKVLDLLSRLPAVVLQKVLARGASRSR